MSAKADFALYNDEAGEENFQSQAHPQRPFIREWVVG